MSIAARLKRLRYRGEGGGGGGGGGRDLSNVM